MISAGLIAAGFSAWKYSEDSLWMKIASGRTSRMRHMASTFALTMCFSAVTKPRSRGQLLVPPAIGGREQRADEHLVDRRVELHPRKPLGESAGVVGEELGEIGVLEIADPVRHAEMAEVDDRHDVELLQVRRRSGRRSPSRSAPGRARSCGAAGRSAGRGCRVPAAARNPPPVLVMAALLHLVDARAAVVDGRDSCSRSRSRT